MTKPRPTKIQSPLVALRIGLLQSQKAHQQTIDLLIAERIKNARLESQLAP